MNSSLDQLVWAQLQERMAPAPRFLATYEEDIIAFAHDCIRWPEGTKPAEYQEAAWADLVRYNREAIRGPHGIGKGFIGSIALLHFWATRDGEYDWKQPVTAGSWNQLIHYFWPEVHKWARLLDPAKVPHLREGKELLDLAIKGRTGAAFAVASTYDPTTEGTKAEGAHADDILYILDEAKLIPEGNWDAAEGALSVGRVKRALAQSTPGAPRGRFHKLFSQRMKYQDWAVRHVTMDEAIAAGRMDPEWAEARARQWGEDSSLFRNRVLGEFASGEDDCIPLSWVEAAQERWRELHKRGWLETQDLTAIGADIADSGEDRTCFALRRDYVISELRYGVGQLRDAEGKPDYGKESVAAADRIKALLASSPANAVIDANTFGATVVGLVRNEYGYSRALPYNGMVRSPKWTDDSGELKFFNVRSAAYWNLRQLCDPRFGLEIALPDDDALVEDLTAPKWTPDAPGGYVKLEEKEHLKKRLGRSPDAGDAVAMAFWMEQLKVSPFQAGFDLVLEARL